MSNVERRRVATAGPAPLGSGQRAFRQSLGRRVAAVAGSILIAVCTGFVIGAPLQAGATASSGPLGLTIASYGGDAVTATPSESASADSDVTYQVTLSDTGSAPQTNVSVPVDLPASFTLDPSTETASAGSTTTVGNVLTWSVPSLAGGASATLTYTETTDTPAALESDVTSAAATSDQDASATSASSSVEVVPVSDLTIGVTDGASSVAAGATDTYAITLTNGGPSEAPDATVTDTFNGAFAALSNYASIDGTTWTDLGGGQFQWTGVDLPSGDSATFSLTGTVPSPLTPGTAFVSVATVLLSPGEFDTNPVYNATDSDVVNGASSAGPLGLAITSFNGDSVTTTPSEAALAGTNVTYRVNVSNTTSNAQTNVSVPVTLAPQFTLDSTVTTSGGTTITTGGVAMWSIPSLGAGASATLTYTETTDAPSALESDDTSASATSTQSTTPTTVAAAVDVIPAADLTITVTDGVETIAPGASDLYTITLTNDGPSPVTNATVADTLSGGFTALAAVSSVDGTSFFDLGTDQFEWTGINLASGAAATFTLMGTLSSTLTAGGAFVNLASGSLPPGQVDTDVSTNAVDSDSVIQVPQAIAFTPPTLGIAGQSATLSATGGPSGNPVSFSVDPSSGPGVCSVTGTDGTTLHYALPGSCVIDANQDGNASFAAAPTETATITVDQEPAFTLDSPPTTATVGQTYAYTFAASGVPAPTYALDVGAPAWLSLNATTGALTGTPPTGTTSFTYSVATTNGVGDPTAGPFGVTVDPVVTNSRDADISVALSCPATVQMWTMVSCSLQLANAGPAQAHSVTADIALPSGTWRVSGSRGGWWYGRAGLWFVGSLDPGSSATFTVCFTATSPGHRSVVAAGLSANPDPNYANNVAVAPIDVIGPSRNTHAAFNERDRVTANHVKEKR
jgi:uncharacterized repeat protein (TIGR01451 family)